MALDHYVPQVYLKQWADDTNQGLLRAIRKSDLKRFTPRTKDVCRIEAGNTNPYLQPPRAIEEFLTVIEPRFNWAVESMTKGEMHREAIFVIAGMMTSTMICSPGGLRINTEPTRRILEEVGRRLDRTGKFPAPPKGLGGNSFTELLEKGIVKVNVNSKHPQAMGIISIRKQISAYGNFSWELLTNPFEDSPFFTSDHPVAIETTTSTLLNRIFPLTPSVAIRIIPDVEAEREDPEFTFKHFRFRERKLTRSKVRYLNELFVRCAEDAVFYKMEAPWVADFVEQNAAFRIRPVSHRIPHDTGTLMLNTLIVSDE